MEFLIIKTAILGIVEGLTEFIPVSSTAHLLLAGKIINIGSGAFLEAMSISIQSGAVLAAAWYFRKTVWYNRSLIGKVIVAFIPTTITGIIFYPIIKFFFDSTLVIALALIAGGIGLLYIKPIDDKKNVSTITYKQAFFIGLSQIASFIPGISRAGATLIGGTLLRISRNMIVPFSFLLAIPTIFGASVVEIQRVEGLTQSQWFLIAFGALIAFATALLTINFFIQFLTKKPLSWFGWYRIIIGISIITFLVK